VLYPGAPGSLSTMNGDNGPDISAALDDLPVLQRGEVASISMQVAVEVCCLTLYIICYIICNNGCICLETRQYSFHQEQVHPDGLPKLKMMSVQDINNLIKDVLHNKDFDPDGVDENMQEMLHMLLGIIYISYWNLYHVLYHI
jgi:hypothetical protein